MVFSSRLIYEKFICRFKFFENDQIVNMHLILLTHASDQFLIFLFFFKFLYLFWPVEVLKVAKQIMVGIII